jgi:hypothetical protein
MRNSLLYIIVGLLFVGYILLEVFGPQPVDWSPSYNKGKVTPFGSQLLYESLPDLFPGQQITNTKVAPSKALREFESQRSNYVIFAEELEIKQADAKALLDFARRGNSVFVAADVFDGPFADSLGIENRSDFIRMLRMSMEDNVGNKLHFTEAAQRGDTEYPLLDYIPYGYLPQAFGAEVLGADEEGTTVFARFQIGEGQILVHAIPLAFTNYYMVDPVNHAYISHALSFLPEQPVIWDEFYKPDRVQMESNVAYVLEQPALRWAWILTLGTLLLFIVFEGKRRQRIIPLQEPVTNTTLEFTQTVARLYSSHADHKDIAEKKIKFFLEYVRNRWMLPTMDLNEEFQLRLAAKSGMPSHEVAELCQVIRGVQSVGAIEAQTLLLLNRKIETFYVNAQ